MGLGRELTNAPIMLSASIILFKMATTTDMKGNVVKMEVDHSDTVDKRIPECEALAAVSVAVLVGLFHLYLCVKWLV